MTGDLLALAKDKLRIPELWRLLCLPGTPGNSCHSPFREDHNPSFSVFDDGLRWKDHATGEHGDAVDFLARVRGLDNTVACREYINLAGITGSSMPSQNGQHQIVAKYDYVDEAGALLFQVVRMQPKTFRQRRPDAGSPDGWTWKLGDVRRVLYRLPEILAAKAAGQVIFLVEGEKDVAALVAQGFAATCNSGGAGKWLDGYTDTLLGADVVIVADKDSPGRNHAQLVASRLYGSAAAVRVVELPDINTRPVKDAHDFFAASGTADEFQAVVAAAMPFTPPAPRPEVSNPIIEFPDEAEESAAVPFPVDALPPVMAGLICATARCAHVPMVMPAVCALGVVSAAVGTGMEMISGPDRTTSANLMILASGESGSGKSEGCRPIIAPLIEHQTRLLDTWKLTGYPETQAELVFLDAQRKAIEKKIAKAMRADTPDPEELTRLKAQLVHPIARMEELRQMTAPTLLIDDFTIEALAMLLRDNRETTFCFSSDARKPIQNLMGRYNPGKTTDESLLLKGYTRETARVDRAKGDALNLHRPCISLCWFVQPDLLDKMMDEDSLTASGLLPRLLLCHTNADWVKYDRTSQGIPDSSRGQWADLVSALLAVYHGAEKAYLIAATPEACQILDHYQHAIVDRRGELADVKSFAARWCENAWRVALVLHAALYGGDAHNHPLAGETAANAMRIVEWFAAAQLDILAKGRCQAAAKVEEEVRELITGFHQHKGRDFITVRDVQRARISATSDAATALLERMVSNDLLTAEDIVPTHGGKTTRIYRTIRNHIPE